MVEGNINLGPLLSIVTTINKIEKSEVVIGDLISDNDNIKVYLGEYKSNQVVVKQLLNIDLSNINNQLIIVSNIESNYIPKFYGLIQEEDFVAVVYQYIEGTLLSQKNLEKLSEEEIIHYCENIAEALECMHKKKFIYRSLNPDNIIVDKNNKAHLISFGIAKYILDGDNTYTRPKGSIFYTAPETYASVPTKKPCDEKTKDSSNISGISTKYDIWAFGCLISYLYSGFIPWTNRNDKDKEGNIIQYNENAVIKFLNNRNRPFPIPDIIENETINEILYLAMKRSPEERCSIETIREKLAKCLS